MAKTGLISKSAERVRETTGKTVDVARETTGKTVDTARKTYTNAKKVAQSTYGSAQENLLVRTQKILAAIVAGLGMAQILSRKGQTQAQKRLHNAQTQTQKRLQKAQNQTQKRLHKAQIQAQKNVHKAQKNLQEVSGNVVHLVKPRLAATQAALGAGLGTAQDVLEQNTKKAQENLHKAQKNLQKLQGAALENAGAGWERTQDLVGKSATQASKGLAQVASGALDLKESVQEQYGSYVSHRKRARTLFRFGLVVGIVLAFLFAPVTGREMRQRISEQWQRYRSYFGF